MKYEIITLENVQIIGMAKEIAFCKGQEECPKFCDAARNGGRNDFQHRFPRSKPGFCRVDCRS